MRRRDFLKTAATGTAAIAAELTIGCRTAKTLGTLTGKGEQFVEEKPNLLFVMTDHQRADSLEMVQAGVEVTPNLNRLAKKGTNFTRAYSACPLCVPARTALATGIYPTRNGVIFNDWKGATANDCKPLHQFLFEAGYDVAHVGVDHIRLKPSLRERVRFAAWFGEAEYRSYKESRGLSDDGFDLATFKKKVMEQQEGERREGNYSNTNTMVWPHKADDFKDLFFCREAVEFLSQRENRGVLAGIPSRAERPFALFVYLWAPHPPLIVPEPYASMFDPAQIVLPENVGKPAEGEPPGRRGGIAAQMAEGISEAEWRKVWAAHLGLVNMADEGIGRILKHLDHMGQGENTLVVFTADHGEHLGQHAMYQKMEMYEQALRVPLVISGPGIRRQQVDTPISHLDVVPTVLETLGIQIPSALDGVSLASSLSSGTRVSERPVFAQYSGNPTTGDIRRCVVLGQYKYIFDPRDAAELYDLESDPLEMKNLAGSAKHREVLLQLHRICQEWASEHGDKLFTV